MFSFSSDQIVDRHLQQHQGSMHRRYVLLIYFKLPAHVQIITFYFLTSSNLLLQDHQDRLVSKVFILDPNKKSSHTLCLLCGLVTHILAECVFHSAHGEDLFVLL